MYASSPFIEETRFGNWFIRTDTWRLRVLCRALEDVQRLMPAGITRYPRILDVGCGYGHSFAELARRFSPVRRDISPKKSLPASPPTLFPSM